MGVGGLLMERDPTSGEEGPTQTQPEPGFLVLASEDMAKDIAEIARIARQRGQNDIAHRLERHITTARRLACRARETEIAAFRQAQVARALSNAMHDRPAYPLPPATKV